MKKLTGLKITNLILLFLFLCQAATGLSHTLLGEEFFEIVHSTVGLLLVITGIIHIILNWGWVRNTLLAR